MFPFQNLYESSKDNTDPAFTVALFVLFGVSICGLIYMIVYSIRYSNKYEKWKNKRKEKK